MEAVQIEYKAVPFEVTGLDIEGRTLEGYAAVFGNRDLVGDVIHRRAFTKTLAERGNKVNFLWQHDKKEPIGRPLEMKEDSRGLFVRALISRTRRGEDALELLADDAISGLSIGYDPVKGGTDYSKQDGQTTRNLRELKLYEFSLTTFPANEQAQVTALKEDAPGPAEAKPAPDVGETVITWAVRDSGDFAPDAFGEGEKFRMTNIGEEDSGIQARIGKLPGRDSTTVQAFVFDKDEFNVEQARAWMDEYRKDAPPDMDTKQMVEGSLAAGGALVPTEHMCECTKCDYQKAADSCDFACPECGGEMELAVAAVEPPAEGGKGVPGPEGEKAVWSRAKINDLPDSAFFYIESGGEKDEEGKTTPRSLRHFPYKDADGTVDLPHLRNAIGRIPQSNAPGLTDAKKKSLQDKARGILEKAQGKAVDDVPDEEKAGRVLAARNAARIVAALQALIDTLEDAGIDIPGYGEAEPDGGGEEKQTVFAIDADARYFMTLPGPVPLAEIVRLTKQLQEWEASGEKWLVLDHDVKFVKYAPAHEPAASDEPRAREQAGPDGVKEETATTPTSEGRDDRMLRLQVAQLGAELELMEV
jgi:HK97 family phage prohead protease